MPIQTNIKSCQNSATVNLDKKKDPFLDAIEWIVMAATNRTDRLNHFHEQSVERS